jgi:predicted transcriptional regulator
MTGLMNQNGSHKFWKNQEEAAMTAFTVRISEEATEKLDNLAAKLDRSRSYVAARAIEDFIAREAWQIAEIEAGLAEAERGDFATQAEVDAVIRKYSRHR